MQPWTQREVQLMHARRECEYCHTVWIWDSGTYSGFLESRINHHRWRCSERSQEERQKWIDATRKRLKRKDNSHSVLIFPGHASARQHQPYG